jgi:LCP family protein required for cell wall assembly
MSGEPRPDPPAGEPAGPDPASPRRRRSFGRRARRALIVAMAAMVILAGSGVAFAVYEQSRIRKVDLTKPGRAGQVGGALSEAKPGEAFNVLVVGSDSRAFAKTTQDRRQFGAAQQADSQRSDTMMVVRIDPKSGQAMILSIARDLYVKIDGGGMDRINTAFADPKNASKSDPGRLIRTIKANFGIPINHYVEVDFEGFRDVVNAIGGVPVYFKYPARDAFSLLDIRQGGCVDLDGNQALAYVRARHLEVMSGRGWEPDGTSDIGRIQRQQDFIRRVLHKAVRDGLTNPVAAVKLINAGAAHLTTDSGFGLNDMRRLATQLRGIGDTGLTTQALTGNPFTASGGADVLKLDPAAAAPVLAAFGSPSRSGSPPTTVRSRPGGRATATTAPLPPPSSTATTAPPKGSDPSMTC